MPVDFGVTRGTVVDRPQANKLTSEIDAQYLLANRGYDSNSAEE